MKRRRSSCRKIGILGGTFNPVHNAHLKMAECAKAQFELDEIWFMPNYIPPHKKAVDIDDLADERIRMLELATEGIPDYRIESYEVQQRGISYTYRTLEALQTQYPHFRFYFIIGGDSLYHFETWRRPRRILHYCSLLVAKRPDESLDDFDACLKHIRSKYKAYVESFDMPLMDISSTNIRKIAASGGDISEMVPSAVAEYIRNEHIYE